MGRFRRGIQSSMYRLLQEQFSGQQGADSTVMMEVDTAFEDDDDDEDNVH